VRMLSDSDGRIRAAAWQIHSDKQKSKGNRS
jgi:hypothetical protein